jgi:hypothetical protein
MAAREQKWSKEPMFDYESKRIYENEYQTMFVMLVAPIDRETRDILIDKSKFYFYTPNQEEIDLYSFSFDQKDKKKKIFLNPKFSNEELSTNHHTARFTSNVKSATDMIIAIVELGNISIKDIVTFIRDSKYVGPASIFFDIWVDHTLYNLDDWFEYPEVRNDELILETFKFLADESVKESLLRTLMPFFPGLVLPSITYYH